MSCELLENCIFFNDAMSGMPATSELIKQRHCLDNDTECARYLVFRALGRPAVPTDLFPSEVARARDIIASSDAGPS